MEYVLSFDVGTSTLKAVLVDREGHIKAMATASYGVSRPAEGYAEQNPQDWWNAVVQTTRKVMEKSKVPPQSVLGMVFATQAIGIIPLSKADGNPLCPAIIWLDSRAEDEAVEIMNMVGGAENFEQLAGIRLNGKDVLAKLLWLNKNRPAIWEQMDCFLDVNGYLIYRCTGEKVYDIASASGICYDPESGGMHGELLGATGFDPDRFPRLVRSEELVGTLTPAAADELHLTTGTKVFGGTNDMQATAVGSGMCDINEVHFYLGTSSWSVAISDENKLLSNGGASLQSAEFGKTLQFYQPEIACTAFNWCIEELFQAESKEMSSDVFGYLDKLVTDIPAGSDSLLFNPWMMGERSPITDLCVRGGFLNLGFSHTRSTCCGR